MPRRAAGDIPFGQAQRSHRFVTALRQLCDAEGYRLLSVQQGMMTDTEAKMNRVHAAVLRAADRLQHFYRYLTPCARQMHRAERFRATVHPKRSFVG
jgi:hypothetical protein